MFYINITKADETTFNGVQQTTAALCDINRKRMTWERDDYEGAKAAAKFFARKRGYCFLNVDADIPQDEYTYVQVSYDSNLSK
jgi:hypothetical protein